MPSDNALQQNAGAVTLEIHFEANELTAIDSYISEIDTELSRPDAIREILRKALASERPNMAKVGVVDRQAQKLRLPKANATGR